MVVLEYCPVQSLGCLRWWPAGESPPRRQLLSLFELLRFDILADTMHKKTFDEKTANTLHENTFDKKTGNTLHENTFEKKLANALHENTFTAHTVNKTSCIKYTMKRYRFRRTGSPLLRTAVTSTVYVKWHKEILTADDIISYCTQFGDAEVEDWSDDGSTHVMTVSFTRVLDATLIASIAKHARRVSSGKVIPVTIEGQMSGPV